MEPSGNSTPGTQESESQETDTNTDASVAESPATSDAAEHLFGPGSPAPRISIAKWMQGEPAEEIEKGQVDVVEFWATWCGPCVKGMPHMAQLQSEYGDKVKFIGVTREDEEKVALFLDRESPGIDGKTWSEVLTYRIALDDNDATNNAYIQAANRRGIPAAFVVGTSGNIE
ncbi:TlpA disulfide reductase family protein [Planctomycetes bacterium CA13]|uniref:TlpA disulfide reductase family protein n=1 Tax=Novipirellula herctigrandis TaxID=2527986 RepID=UPI0011B6BCA0